MSKNNNPVLYIVARSDLASLNPGKLAAQCCHAANDFMNTLKKEETNFPDSNSVQVFNKWLKESSQHTFGTTIVLDGYNEENMKYIFDTVTSMGIDGRWVMDDTYPVKDGEVTHLLPINTCFWLFFHGEDYEENALNFVKTLDLYP